MDYKEYQTMPKSRDKVIKRLITDGYIDHKFSSFYITENGKKFIRNGGYTFQFTIKVLKFIALVIGIVASIFTVISFFSLTKN